MDANEARQLVVDNYKDVDYMEIVFKQIKIACNKRQSSVLFDTFLEGVQLVKSDICQKLQTLGYTVYMITKNCMVIEW